MREVNNTLEKIRRRRDESERNVRQAVALQQERRAREEAIVVGVNEAVRGAAVAQARQQQPSPKLIFAGRRIPLPASRLVDEVDEGRMEEVSSDSSFDRALDEMEGELHRASVSNPDDAPKPEVSEESVAQEQIMDDEAEVAKEDSELPELMEVDMGGSNEGQEDATAGDDQPSNAGNSEAEKDEKQETEVVDRPDSPGNGG